MENVLFYHQTHTQKEWKRFANLYWKHVGVIVNTLVDLASTCTILNKFECMEFDICEENSQGYIHRRWIMSHLKMLQWQMDSYFHGNYSDVSLGWLWVRWVMKLAKYMQRFKWKKGWNVFIINWYARGFYQFASFITNIKLFIKMLKLNFRNYQKKLHEEEKFKAAKTNNFLTNNFFLPSQSTAKKKFFMSNFSKYTLTIFLICLLLCRKWKFIFDTTETANNLFFPSLF